MVHPRSDLDLEEVVFEPPAGAELVQFARGTVVFSQPPCEPQKPRPLSSTAYLEEKRRSTTLLHCGPFFVRNPRINKQLVPFIGLPLSLTASYVLDLRPPVKFEMACDMSEELQAKLERWARSTVQRENPDRKAVIIKSQTWGCRCTMSDAGRFPSRGRALVGLLFCPLMFLWSMVLAKTSLVLEMWCAVKYKVYTCGYVKDQMYQPDSKIVSSHHLRILFLVSGWIFNLPDLAG